jgi:tetratricopeptide (TPR) repeat protein
MKLRSVAAGIALLLPAASLAQDHSSFDCQNEEMDSSERISACTEVINAGIDKLRSEAYRHRGNAYADDERFDLAIADETAAIQLNPRDPYAYNLRAWAFLKSGKTKEALADVGQALALDPKFADALDTRGRIHEALGMTQEAIANYRQALAANPEHEDSKEALSRLGLKQ